MADSLATRATSLAVSTAALGLAAFAALTFTISLRSDEPPPAGGTIVASVEPPPQQRPADAQEDPAPALEDFALFVAPPLAPVVASGVFATASWPTQSSGPAIIEDPTWTERPHDLSRYYPPRALARGMEGEAVLDCRVDVFGALACSVRSETPAGWGFGAAALRIAADHRMAPATRDGMPVEGRYRMQVPFNLN